MHKILNRVVLYFFAGLIAQSSFAVSAMSALKWNRSFVVIFENTSSKIYTLAIQPQGGVCAHSIILKNQEVSCDNIPPLKSMYVMYQNQVVGRIIFRPVVKPSGLYFWPATTGVLKTCEIIPPNQVKCHLSDPL